jgi:site-specific DNA recombinase
MRVALYLRVSSPRQKDGVSLDDQETICRAYADRQGWRTVAVYSEPGRSAFTERMEKRIAFQQMLNDARARHFDVVLVYKMNRFARKVLIQYQAAAELERCKVKIASATEPIDRKTASGRLTFGMLAVIAEAQSDQLAEKMRDTRQAEARGGRHVGPVPTGYTREQGALIPNDRAEAPQYAFALYATCQHSFSSVADALNVAGYRTNADRPFSKFQVEEMLKNPVYIGRVRCNGREYDGNHPALIEQKTWDAVQAEITRRAGMGNHESRGAARPAMLSGLARCSNCGAVMWFMPQRGAGHKYDYYVCSAQQTRARSVRCNLPFVRAADAEAHVIASLAVLTQDRALMSAVADELDTLAREAKAQLPVGVDRARLEGRLKRLQKLYLDGAMEETEYERERDNVRAQLAQADAPIAVAPIPDVRQAAAYLADLPQLLCDSEPHDARALLASLFDVVYLTPHGAMAVRPTQELAPLLRELRLKIKVWWAGWGSNRRSDTPYTLLLPRRIATYRGT